jgi:hypothetical protein
MAVNEIFTTFCHEQNTWSANDWTKVAKFWIQEGTICGALIWLTQGYCFSSAVEQHPLTMSRHGINEILSRLKIMHTLRVHDNNNNYCINISFQNPWVPVITTFLNMNSAKYTLRRVWPVDGGCLLLLRTWFYPWYSTLYILQELWDLVLYSS